MLHGASSRVCAVSRRVSSGGWCPLQRPPSPFHPSLSPERWPRCSPHPRPLHWCMVACWRWGRCRVLQRCITGVWDGSPGLDSDHCSLIYSGRAPRLSRWPRCRRGGRRGVTPGRGGPWPWPRLAPRIPGGPVICLNWWIRHGFLIRTQPRSPCHCTVPPLNLPLGDRWTNLEILYWVVSCISEMTRYRVIMLRLNGYPKDAPCTYATWDPKMGSRWIGRDVMRHTGCPRVRRMFFPLSLQQMWSLSKRAIPPSPFIWGRNNALIVRGCTLCHHHPPDPHRWRVRGRWLNQRLWRRILHNRSSMRSTRSCDVSWAIPITPDFKSPTQQNRMAGRSCNGAVQRQMMGGLRETA